MHVLLLLHRICEKLYENSCFSGAFPELVSTFFGWLVENKLSQAGDWVLELSWDPSMSMASFFVDTRSNLVASMAATACHKSPPRPSLFLGGRGPLQKRCRTSPLSKIIKHH